MTFEELFNLVKTEFQKADMSGVKNNFALQINLTGEAQGTFYVLYKDGTLIVEPQAYPNREVALTLSSDNFLKFFNNKLDPIIAYTTGRLKIDGDIKKALELQKLLKR